LLTGGGYNAACLIEICEIVMRNPRYLISLVLVTVVGMMIVQGQDNPMPIQADNVMTIESVLTIDFNNVPPEAGELISGWLRLDPSGNHAVTVNRANDLLVWELSSGDLVVVYRIVGADGTNANMMDIAWNADGTEIHSLHTDGESYFIGVYTLQDDTLRTITVPAEGNRPVRVWASTEPDQTWVEVLTVDPNIMPYVLQLDVETGEVLTKLDSIAEADRQSQVRIGRMPAPLAVTSSIEGEVHLWDLEAGTLLHQVQVDGMPTFGHINGASGRRLVWRDTQSESLNLLDFDTEENTEIAQLGGSYVQALLLSPTTDVVIGVNIDLEPIIVAWDVASGERLDLGFYRECSRTPDMVQISEDGTTLAIGCDTGIDIWRVGAGS
jgi:WD40 repeat protein